jgi:hypothetical protein
VILNENFATGLHFRWNERINVEPSPHPAAILHP